MPVYYFHIHGRDGTIPDDEGSELADEDAARDEALTAVREMVADTIRRGGNPADGRKLWVADESGTVLFAIPFDQIWGT
jgi:hypothetical protein